MTAAAFDKKPAARAQQNHATLQWVFVLRGQRAKCPSHMPVVPWLETIALVYLLGHLL
jgi:hypothetical protein